MNHLNALDIMDQLSSATFGVKDRDGRYLFANKKILEQCRLKYREDIIGQHNREVFLKEESSLIHTYEEQDMAVIQEEKEVSVLNTWTKPDGTLEIFIGSKAPYRDNQGACIGLIGQSTQLKTGSLHNLGKYLFSSSQRFIKNRAHAFSIQSHLPNHQLSTRESECLFYLLRGKSAKETGLLLTISPKTVETHLQHIRDKFGCQNKSQLIEKALAEGLLFFLPESLAKKPLAC